MKLPKLPILLLFGNFLKNCLTRFLGDDIDQLLRDGFD